MEEGEETKTVNRKWRASSYLRGARVQSQTPPHMAEFGLGRWTT
jgi:hypothetical protein